MIHIVYSDDEGRFIDDNEEGELVPVDPIPLDELPF